jgi:hypothetical protein
MRPWVHIQLACEVATVTRDLIGVLIFTSIWTIKTGRGQRDCGLAKAEGKNFQDSLVEVCRMLTRNAVHTHSSIDNTQIPDSQELYLLRLC